MSPFTISPFPTLYLMKTHIKDFQAHTLNTHTYTHTYLDSSFHMHAHTHTPMHTHAGRDHPDVTGLFWYTCLLGPNLIQQNHIFWALNTPRNELPDSERPPDLSHAWGRNRYMCGGYGPCCDHSCQVSSPSCQQRPGGQTLPPEGEAFLERTISAFPNKHAPVCFL